MADKTKIEWTDATWNPITGCSVVSPGCTNCYAMRLAGTRLKHHPTREGLTTMSKAGPVWNGEVRFNEKALVDPLRWKRSRMIFVCAHGDLFAEGVPHEWLNRIFAVMAMAGQHTFQLLTKRPERMREYLKCRISKDLVYDIVVRSVAESTYKTSEQLDVWPLPNVWLGVSVEDQRRADERIPHLLDTPAAKRFVSAEPLLGPIDLCDITVKRTVGEQHFDALFCEEDAGDCEDLGNATLDWVIAGGESGPGARPIHPDWARSLRDQCAAAGVPFFFKQWGEYEPIIDRERDDPDWRRDYGGAYSDSEADICWLNVDGGRGFHGERFHVMRKVGKRYSGRLLDGIEHNAMPPINGRAA